MNDILVFGSGACARETAGLLSDRGLDILLALPGSDAQDVLPTSDQKRIRIVDGTRWIGCRGEAGAFEVTFDINGTRVDYAAAAIVVVDELQHSANFSAYGLHPSDRVISLSEAEARLDGGDAPWPPGAQIALLNSWRTDSHPQIAARMLRLCLRAQKSGAPRTAFLTGNLKVSENGMEGCYQEAKKAGALFLKFSDDFPRIEMLKDGRIQIDYRDETIRMDFGLTAEVVVVDETVQAHPALAHVGGLLRLDGDAAGFLQSENVRRLSHLTNRRGIFVAGGARGVPGTAGQLSEAVSVVEEVCAFLRLPDVEPRRGVQIDQGRCARCLTCYRLCPYGAIEITPHMSIMAQACQGCGLCAAGCPNQAIQVEDAALSDALRALKSAPAPAVGAAAPRIAAFVCSRSAAQARQLALEEGHRLPPGMIFVEGLCGGTFSVHHLLSAFEAGVDGVMLLACHPGNCHSENGTTHAGKRAEQAAKALAAAGIEPERLTYRTLAANMACEFAQAADAFSRRIAALGPLFGGPRKK
jgi:quinone-modifying oxidoreductase, subunit QmoB